MPSRAGPFLVAHARVGLDAVGQQRLLLVGDQADFILPYLHAAVRPIQVRVTAGAGLKLQGLCCLVESPDSSEGNIQVLDHQLAAALEHRWKLGAGIERHRHLGIQRGHANALLERFLGAGALLDFPMQFTVRLA
jgi:hypothetical protein